ncbi:MAG: Dam family site-specific DNA-(adenine-N6)-methyltransferase [Opitutus sp.]|nr:Dam family site-specific DNA-(adenine-N6)-methyltransferase [Opitutus sp.]
MKYAAGVLSQRPFLKWAGGKTKLVPAIREFVPPGAARLIEPFVGGGAVALNLPLPAAILADANEDLISVYRELQRGGEKYIAQCAALFTPSANTAAVYYARRAEFNMTPNRGRKACLFVYLNRHGYNGLCRYNARGGFNVPFGRYKAPRLPRDALRSFHARLQTCELRHADFRDVLAEAREGDFVYCDPPYVPASATANFTAYAKGGFGPPEQAALAAGCRDAAHRGATVVVSNHDTPGTRELYAEADERRELLVGRRISCNAEKRAAARELLAVYRPASLLV